ncbi:MAG: response regulator [Candidatus Omnitrophica bacterium]|nr:response regulator [Candidatus Omnitrophota bacterium]
MSGKVLVIDDEPKIVGILKSFLEAKGLTVVTASDGEQGMTVAMKEQPDLVLCDVKMPKKDGYTFLKEFREKNAKRCPFIFVTAKEEPQDIMTGYRLDADFYVTKPFQLEELYRNMEKLLRLAPLIKPKDEQAP